MAELTKKQETALWLIAIYKLVEGVLLFALGIGVFRLLHSDLAALATRWAKAFRIDPGNRYLHSLILFLPFVTEEKLKLLGVGTFIYSVLHTTEGIGLLLRKRWGEYFTIICTSLLLPLEVYELVHRATAIKATALLANLAVVVYLIVVLRRTSHPNPKG